MNTSFVTLVSWVIGHGYFLFFVAAFFEGPLVTAAAGVASAMGYYSFPIIIGLSVLGDLTADVVYYTIGYWGRKTLIVKYGHRIGITRERIARMERLLHGHPLKTLALVKLAPVLPVPGLIIIGVAHVPLKKFIRASLIITLPKSLLFGLIGLLAGRAYTRLSGTIASGPYVLFGIAVLLVLVYWGYQRMTASVVERLEKDK